ncbi:TetR/AcrR family transcriptional regulator [Nocardioides salarius]|uniref:TetR/AcrR family transcriptional regulator n=1 Tax=Nocardioides salarius TaxID=374513 RepID=UPI0030FA262E
MARAGLSLRRLAEAGAELADEEGFAALTPSELARRVGVRTASLYSHVRSAQDLREQVALLALEEMADLLGDALAGRSGRDALVALAGVYRDYARAHPGRYEASRLRMDPTVAATSAGPRHAVLTRAVLRGYGVEGDDQTHGVRLVGSTVHGFVSLELAGGFAHSTPEAQESWERVLDGVDLVLRTWGEN